MHVSKALAPSTLHWLTALKAARDRGIHLACGNLDLNALAEKDVVALQRAARRTCIRECNFSLPVARLIGPTACVKLGQAFNILLTIPGTPLIVVKLFEGSFTTRQGRLWCDNTETGQGLCDLTTPFPSFYRYQGILDSLSEDLLAVDSGGHAMLVNLTYSPDYQKAQMDIPHSWELPLNLQREIFCLSPHLLVYAIESSTDQHYDITAVSIKTGLRKVFPVAINMPGIIVATWDTDRNLALTVLQFGRHSLGQAASTQLMLPPALDLSTVAAFVLEECSGSVLIKDTYQ
ncbi:hypothetical protein C8J56DRAFT_1042213 [Mycena floridula]|nr:hypothetical protein C8J56DRAFT_1042213 [Mycena floridula]